MSVRPSRPLYISGRGRQLFALHYPADGSPRGETVVIMPPMPQEMMRAQTALGQLAKRLQAEGLDVVRFDYSATGDSDGEASNINLGHWLDDCRSIAEWAQTSIQNPKLSFLGLRLGAALAIQCSVSFKLDRLILWDPIVDGIGYWQDMEEAHEQMFELNPVEPPFRFWRYKTPQCWGFAFPTAFKAELASVSAALLLPQASQTHLILTEPDAKAKAIFIQWQRQGLRIELNQVNEPMFWGDARYLRIRAFANMPLRVIESLWGAA